MPSLIGVTGADGVQVAANYLRVLQSPGAALAGLNGTESAPLLTFSTPNLRMFKVVLTNANLNTTPDISNSNWSKAIRALQVTSEIFAVFAPSVDGTTFCYLAPDFNTNPGETVPNATMEDQVAEANHTFGILERALTQALGGTATATVSRTALSGVTVA